MTSTLQTDATIPRPPARRHITDTRRRRVAADFRALRRNGDQRARERLVVEYLPLAAAVARRFVHADQDLLDDVRQVASLALVKAVDRYDPDAGFAFSSFAVPTIEGEIRRFFRDHTWAVRLPRDLQERAVRIARDRDALTEELGRNPTAGELAEWCNCTLEEIVDALEAGDARTSQSLDAREPAGEEPRRTIGDRLGVDDQGFECAEMRAQLEPFLDALSPRERAVVLLHAGHDMTQREIGKRVGCSQMQVSRIYRRAIATLTSLASDSPDYSTARQTTVASSSSSFPQTRSTS